jgi:hypothetical protein
LIGRFLFVVFFVIAAFVAGLFIGADWARSGGAFDDRLTVLATGIEWADAGRTERLAYLSGVFDARYHDASLLRETGRVLSIPCPEPEDEPGMSVVDAGRASGYIEAADVLMRFRSDGYALIATSLDSFYALPFTTDTTLIHVVSQMAELQRVQHSP